MTIKKTSLQMLALAVETEEDFNDVLEAACKGLTMGDVNEFLKTKDPYFFTKKNHKLEMELKRLKKRVAQLEAVVPGVPEKAKASAYKQ